jgi:endonuclease VIII
VPEGDTVWNTAQALQQALAGGQLLGSDFRVPRLATVDLTGATVLESASRGKHLLLRLATPDGRLTLHSHLRMDGSWRTYRPGTRWTGGPAHLIRVVLRTTQAVAVGYHLHDVALVPTDEEETLVGHLGPDLLGPDWDAAEAVRRLGGQPDRTIGEALLDQRNVAGIGTIYRAETLFLRGVNPWTPVGAVAELDRLLALAHRLMTSNLGRPGGPVMTGDTRRGRRYWVYGRGGEPCRRCGTRIDRGSMGPAIEERVVYWCPACQPDSAPARP